MEDYSERQRCLLFAITPNDLPVHVVIDYRPEELEIVTIYIPDKREWISFKRRKKPVRKRRKS
ncbi:MAG: hypothetical protein HYZ49_21110 [Chloroflexi bacterium]|nr:hypothetical protein [Chloroflexota bacterium]